MKVEVLTVRDVEIKKFRYWSDWIDVAVFNYSGYGYLLQMKINRRNRKKFNCIAYSSIINAAHANTVEADNLEQM